MEENNSHTDNYDFQHGYQSGLEAVDKNTYEGFLSSQVNFEWLKKQIDERKSDIKALEESIEQVKNRQKTAFDTLQEKMLQVGLYGKRKERLEEQVYENQASIHDLTAKREKSVHKYSLLAGFVYLFAGISFMAGDLIISHEIVAYALNIRNNIEAWSFAVGLAMISILLKPAYERLIESPYAENTSANSKKIYAWFKGAMVLFAVATLFILGWFRYEAYKTDKLKDGVNKTIKNIQNESIDPLNPSAPLSQETARKIDQQLKTFDVLNEKLVNSPWALASFVLSGVLFAIAGAICLGIAFPVLQCYWYRWIQIDTNLRRLKKEKKKLVPELQEAEALLADNVVQKNVLENDLNLLPGIEELETRKRNYENEIKDCVEQLKLSEMEVRIASFNDGFNKGNMVRNEIGEDEASQFIRENYFTTSSLASKAKSYTGDKALFSKKPALRPHQQLRRLISEDFNED
ncbi:hypothetical protein SAMN04515674_11871 [Pseudarcicella hirudinis]|uniref:Uncharacterized protein n=1 Tax=Pseudarcicella hirudinis TaxID=1079859 RepID=A0A1I5YEU7_9BACT|nr:hypothetical protein [Pseudarcicella hirudinis]SFQ42693.1 hypothetical protein SAMN04515674_11871 [Pseudarcicella hirudinis]